MSKNSSPLQNDKQSQSLNERIYRITRAFVAARIASKFSCNVVRLPTIKPARRNITKTRDALPLKQVE